MRTTVALDGLTPLVEGRHENPFEILGPHEVTVEGRRAVAVRAYLPDSTQAWVVDKRHGNSRPMRRIHPAGLFEAICPLGEDGERRYLLRVADPSGRHSTMHDPYAFSPLLTDYDLHLLDEGRHWQSYDKLARTLRTIDGVDGVNFAVWAPNATGVSVVGDFNSWDGRRHPMRKHIPSGFWELFVPGLGEGTLYKYQVRHHGDRSFEKSDPYGFAAEVPPRTASKVADLDRYNWHDAEWMAKRPRDTTGSTRRSRSTKCTSAAGGGPATIPTRWLSYRELAHQLVEYCKEMGYTHIELLPVSEHPFSGSWGYQTVGYYAATSRYGTPQDFMYFVDLLPPERHRRDHRLGAGPLPARRPRPAAVRRHARSTSTPIRARASIRDWGTLIFNYGRHEVRNFLLSNALFWLDKYHIDGLRVDAVASMLYLDYSREDGRVAAQRVRRPRKPRRPSRSSRNSTSRSTCSTPAC